jgi:lysine 6-dehydrogenase
MSKKSILVLGAGMVGKTIARDLSTAFHVTAADASRDALAKLKAFSRNAVQTLELDVSHRAQLQSAVKPFDLVIGAVPGFLGFQTATNVIDAGKNLVDISFFPEDAFELDALAKKKKVTAVVDCGVAPGLGNVLLGYWNKKITVSHFACYVGGLPQTRTYPFDYKSPFSPVDVIEEYTRPARLMENGSIVTKPALSESELLNFPHIGTLEAFNTDGLRSLLHTMKHIPNMKEKTLRYIGHIEKINVLQAAGFFSEKEVLVKGVRVKPLDLTSKLLFDLWKPSDAEEEFTVMKIRIDGKKQTRPLTIEYNLYDRTDIAKKESSMARTTGFTCAAAASLVLSGMYKRKGISPPEFLGEDESCTAFMLEYLRKRGVVLDKTES